tara:strand:- start:1122 stop:2261 length:1140 start_codon:yes stop_codon:yes gene_type:complete
MFKIKSHLTPHLIAGLFLTGPALISVIFGILSIPIPATIIIYFLAIILIIAQLNFNTLNLKFSKFNLLYIIYLVYFVIALLSFFEFSQYEATEFKFITLVYRIVIPVFFIFFSSILIKNKNKIDVFKIDQVYFKLWVKASFVYVIMFYLFREIQPDGRYILPGLNNPIWISRYFGGALVFSIIYYINYNKKINFIIIIYLTVALLSSGSRGPILAAIITIGLYFYNTRIKYKKLFLLILISFLIIYFLYYFSSYLYGDTGYSLVHRFNALTNALELFNFNGHGLSSFGRLIFNEDSNRYPHNVFAELIFEFGFIGFVFGFFLCYFVFSSYSYSVIGYLSMYFFINSQVSGDLVGNALLFTGLVIAWSIKNNKTKFLSNN